MIDGIGYQALIRWLSWEPGDLYWRHPGGLLIVVNRFQTGFPRSAFQRKGLFRLGGRAKSAPRLAYFGEKSTARFNSANRHEALVLTIHALVLRVS
jgi:hypothetical protein